MPEPELRRDPTLAECQLIIDNGRRYIPALLPPDISRFRPGMCFDASAIQALKSGGKYGYVEGLALDADDHSRWLLHAWMTDGVYAFDPTWAAEDPDTLQQQPMPTIYVGIQMDVEAVGRFMVATTYQGVIFNRWRNPTLADKAIFSLTKV